MLMVQEFTASCNVPLARTLFSAAILTLGDDPINLNADVLNIHTYHKLLAEMSVKAPLKRSREDDTCDVTPSVKDLPPTKKVVRVICNAVF